MLFSAARALRAARTQRANDRRPSLAPISLAKTNALCETRNASLQERSGRPTEQSSSSPFMSSWRLAVEGPRDTLRRMGRLLAAGTVVKLILGKRVLLHEPLPTRFRNALRPRLRRRVEAERAVPEACASRRGRGVAGNLSPRNIHVAAAASPRLVATEDPRRCRGVAATRR